MGNEQGYTLVEVMIAMVILTVGLLGVAGMQTSAITSNSFSRAGTEAIHLGEEMVDRIRANAGTNPSIYHNIDTSTDCPTTSPAAEDCEQWKARLTGSGLVNPVGTVSVAEDTILEGAATITVDLSWGNTGAVRSISFTTILETWGT